MNALFKEPGAAPTASPAPGPDRLAQVVAQEKQSFVPPRDRNIFNDELADDYSTLPTTGFNKRLQATGVPAAPVEDRRPVRPGVIPGQYGPVTPEDATAFRAGQAATAAATPPTPPPLGDRLSKAAGYDTLVTQGAASAFDAAARDQLRMAYAVRDAQKNAVIDRWDSSTHQASKPTLKDLIDQINQRRRLSR
jgi:hypothetical protein